MPVRYWHYTAVNEARSVVSQMNFLALFGKMFTIQILPRYDPVLCMPDKSWPVFKRTEIAIENNLYKCPKNDWFCEVFGKKQFFLAGA